MKYCIWLLIFFGSVFSFAEGIYTDTWVNWTPAGKVYDVVCFSKKNGDRIIKDIRVVQFNRRAFQYKESSPDAELKAMSSKGCYFEQKDPHPVSRDEFFEEIVGVKCNLNQIPFKDGDFRILGTNSTTTSVKRLRDGRVWILPTNDCTFTTQLQKKPMIPAPAQQQQIQLSGELSFPGQSDQGNPHSTQPQPKLEESKASVPVSQAVTKKAPDVLPDKPRANEPIMSTPIKRTEPSPFKGSTIKSLINTLN
jgi:hypothetical protein